MTNPQRLAFIQYQLEMLRGVIVQANLHNNDANKNVLFTKLRNQLFEAAQTIELLQQ
jgi:hypothetical protein